MEKGIQKCRYIKYLIENQSGFDLSSIEKNRELADLKKTYCYLCKTRTNANLKTIADVLSKNYDHASVIYSVNKFMALYETNQLTCIATFKDVEESINLFENVINDFLESQSQEDVFNITIKDYLV